MSHRGTVGTAESPEQEWSQIVASIAESAWITLAETVNSKSVDFADAFYKYMLQHPQAAVFLSQDIVNRRLHVSMERWLCQLFQHPPVEPAVLVANQRHVGEVHARIQLPVYLVTRGARLIKQNIEQALTGL